MLKGLGGLGNMGNLGSMLKQAMEVKAKMEEMKEQLGDVTVESSIGGGIVTATLNGRFEVLALHIDPELLNKDEVAEIEVMVQAAINDGIRRVQELVKEKMLEVTGGLDLPGLTS